MSKLYANWLTAQRASPKHTGVSSVPRPTCLRPSTTLRSSLSICGLPGREPVCVGWRSRPGVLSSPCWECGDEPHSVVPPTRTRNPPRVADHPTFTSTSVASISPAPARPVATTLHCPTIQPALFKNSDSAVFGFSVPFCLATSNLVDPANDLAVGAPTPVQIGFRRPPFVRSAHPEAAVLLKTFGCPDRRMHGQIAPKVTNPK